MSKKSNTDLMDLADSFEFEEEKKDTSPNQGWQPNSKDKEWTKQDYSLFHTPPPKESIFEKFGRVFGHQPLVPIGCIATVGFLAGGLRTLFTGNRKRSQQMMKGRVGAQAATIALLCVGVFTQERNATKKKEAEAAAAADAKADLA